MEPFGHPFVLTLVRLAVQALIFFGLLTVVLGVTTHYTGPAEKAALIGVGVLLVGAAVAVRRLGQGRPAGRL